MSFNIRLFREQVQRSLTETEGTPARLTPRRVLFLVFFFPVFTLVRVVNWLGLKLDDLFHREYQKQELQHPVFILGNPRSGTTFLHRLMARDRKNFSCLRMWEIYFAPSVIQRKLIWLVQNLDNLMGEPLQKWIFKTEEQMWMNNPIHKTSLREADEDEAVLFNIWSSIFTTFFFPHPDLVRQYALFDKSVPRKERREVMRFYKSVLKRHIYAHGGDKTIISKNPTFSPKVEALYETFPDVRIIYLVRNPLQTVPSMISWLAFQWKQFCDLEEDYVFKEFLLEMAEEWYRYPLEKLAEAPQESYMIVKYDDLIANPDETIRHIYQQFGFEISRRYARVLRREARRARRYKSGHKYSLGKMGLTRKEIIRRFKFVFDRFGFETR